MTNEELNTALYQKLSAEQEQYKGWLLTQPPEEILHHTYEYTVRQDIVLTMEEHNLTDEQCKALLSSSSPLADIFYDFEKIETDHMDCVRDSIENRANDVIARQNQQPPLYMQSAEYAREHGELDAFRASHRANVACKEAIEAAIREHYYDNQLHSDKAIPQVAGKFGMERTLCVLAFTGRYYDWDGRISRENKGWAKEYPVPNISEDRSRAYVLTSHPGLSDLFMTQMRKEAAEQNRETGTAMVETNIGKMPVEDYREIIAAQSGFDSYDAMYAAGLRIGGGYDKDKGRETEKKPSVLAKLQQQKPAPAKSSTVHRHKEPEL